MDAQAPERLRRQVRTMALVCTLFGPVVALMAGATYGAKQALSWAERQPGAGAVPKPPMLDLALDFSARSLPVMLGLGAVFVAAGALALWRGRPGLAALQAAGWLAVGGMVWLGVIWVQVGRGHDAGWAFNGLGVLVHLIQALAVLKAVWFLRRDDVRHAVVSSG